MKTIELTDQEIVVVRQMMDAALKSMGGGAARAYVVLDTKFQQALEAQPMSPADATAARAARAKAMQGIPADAEVISGDPA